MHHSPPSPRHLCVYFLVKTYRRGQGGYQKNSLLLIEQLSQKLDRIISPRDKQTNIIRNTSTLIEWLRKDTSKIPWFFFQVGECTRFAA